MAQLDRRWQATTVERAYDAPSFNRFDAGAHEYRVTLRRKFEARL
jgi:hypothetical protein